ncbi:MAG: phage baseplate assembly protein V [Atribacterota bacterium]|nr:phage baseplate assembly protein V [Atribacterota bacterium]
MCLPKVGDYVVVGFLRGNYSTPVVLGSLHPIFRCLNVSGATENPEDTQGPTKNGVVAEEDRYLTVYPSGLWTKVNRYGEIEISFPLGKGTQEYGGFHIKIGRDDLIGEAKNVVDSVVKAKEMVDQLKKASAILDIPKVKEVINAIKAQQTDFQKGIDTILQNKEVQKILSGDPQAEEDYDDGGCCCNAEQTNNPPANCSCGAKWATCPTCQAHVSGCPYKQTWTCRSCGTPVPNPRYTS